jgi:alpha-L-fucosidase
MDLQLGMFLHFGLNTFTGQQSGDGKHPASAFNPTDLNASQWVATAKEMGAGYACLTAQHEGGFALWNSSYTNYSSVHSPYGKDVLREFVDACHSQEIEPCLYFSVSCDAYHGCPQGKCDGDPSFIAMKLGQLHELLGGSYGNFAYMWTDHADGDPLFTEVTRTANELQPEMLILGQDVVNIGNEYGRLWYDELWSQDNTSQFWQGGPDYQNSTCAGPLDPTVTLGGHPNGQYWKSREADKTVSSGGWFWSHGCSPQSAPSLMELYLQSVGLGSNLILNFPPGPSGQIEPAFVDVARQFGQAVTALWANPIQTAHDVHGRGVVLNLPANQSVSRVVLREDLSTGQRIAGFIIEAFINRYGVEMWYQVGSGSTVGNQRIVVLPFGDKDPSQHYRVRVTATAGGSAALPPHFRSIQLYNGTLPLPPAPSPSPPAPANCLTGTWTSLAEPTVPIRVVENGTAVTTMAPHQTGSGVAAGVQLTMDFTNTITGAHAPATGTIKDGCDTIEWVSSGGNHSGLSWLPIVYAQGFGRHDPKRNIPAACAVDSGGVIRLNGYVEVQSDRLSAPRVPPAPCAT